MEKERKRERLNRTKRVDKMESEGKSMTLQRWVDLKSKKDTKKKRKR